MVVFFPVSVAPLQTLQLFYHRRILFATLITIYVIKENHEKILQPNSDKLVALSGSRLSCLYH